MKLRVQAPGLAPTAVFLTIVLVILRLTEVIGWPWVWVLAPLWVTLVVFVVLFVIILVTVPIVAGHLRRKLIP